MNSGARICVLIPVYNNAGTIRDVVERSLAQVRDVIVVNDGSTDGSLDEASLTGARILDLGTNHGKGAAMREGFRLAIKEGFTHAITLDGDGQHFPEDIPLIINAIQSNPEALITGSRNLRSEGMPGGNTFANKFSNFWFTVETWQRIPDTQTGFRAYPLRKLPSLKVMTSRYEAELSLLVFSAWKGVRIQPVPVRVYYPPEGERVSSFRPGRDFLRISLLNTILCILAILYGWPRMIFQRIKK